MFKFKDEYLEYLSSHKSSKNTIESYLSDFEKFSGYLELEKISSYKKVDYELIERYCDFLKANGKSTSTVIRNVASIRSFYNFLIDINIAEENPTKTIKIKKEEKKNPEILTHNEVILLLSQPDIKDPKGCRDKAMLELLYATGIRVSELISLNMSDINLSRGLIYCRTEKNSRSIPLYPAAISAISDYIYRVRNLIVNKENEDALFINLNGNRLTRQGFWKIIKAYASMAKISKEITPHALRHAFALHLLENGANIEDVQSMMGHCDISSTKVYISMLDNHSRDVYNNFHPGARRTK